MSIKKYFVLLVISCAISIIGFAQNTITISGTVTDEETGDAIEGAEILVDENKTVNYTNNDGKFWITVELVPDSLDYGDKLTLMIEKNEEGYRLDKPISHTIARRENRIDENKTKLKKKTVIAGYVYTKCENKKVRIPVEGATIFYLEKQRGLLEGGKSNDRGYFVFPINREIGDEVKLQVEAEGYRSFLPEELKEYTIKKDDLVTICIELKAKITDITREMPPQKPEITIAIEPYLWATGGISVLTAFITGNESDKAYDEATAIINPNRMDDLKKANNFKKASAVTLYGGVFTIVTGAVIYCCKKRKRKKSKLSSALQPNFILPNNSGISQIGLVYIF